MPIELESKTVCITSDLISATEWRWDVDTGASVDASLDPLNTQECCTKVPRTKHSNGEADGAAVGDAVGTAVGAVGDVEGTAVGAADGAAKLRVCE